MRIVKVDCSKECIETVVEREIRERERRQSDEPLVFSLLGDCGAVKLSDRHHDVTVESLDLAKPATVCGAPVRSGCQACLDSKSTEIVAVAVSNTADVGVLGLRIAGLSTTQPGYDAIGIRVEGSQRVAIVANTIKDIGVDWKSADGPADKFNARGIWVTGTRSQPSAKIVVAHNDVALMRLGYSEAIAASGEAVGIAIVGNTVQNVDNIGIDIEGDGAGVAREALVCGNDVGPLDLNNQAYWTCNDNVPTIKKGKPSCDVDSDGHPNAAGIYVDGGRAIDIAFNRVHGFDYGVQVSTEQRVPPPTGIRIWSNTLADQEHSNIHLGYRKGCGVGDCGTLILANSFKPVRNRQKCASDGRIWALQEPEGICRPTAAFYGQIKDVPCAPTIKLGP